MDNWIYPFQGRNQSLSVAQNFLWNHDNIYIMDNHRAALWCWLKHLKPSGSCGVFHIDAHYDCASVGADQVKTIPNLDSILFDDYLKISIPGGMGQNVPLIRWDNYLSLFLSIYHKQIADFLVATHGIGTPPAADINWYEIHMSQLPQRFRDLLGNSEHDGWILNIDLDYFFSRQPNSFARLHSETYIGEIFKATRDALLIDQVTCLTICLSPECCGGWGLAEELCYQFCDLIGVEFRLPVR